MFINFLLGNPLVALVWITVIFISLTVHEFSHALAANKLGDKTAEYMGRLTLNPIKHIDPIGLIPLLLFGFGWAKPVPFNPYNLQDPKRDAVIIALAGPFSNLVIAIIAGIILQIMGATAGLDPNNLLVVLFLLLLVLINLFLLFLQHHSDSSARWIKAYLDAILVKPEHQKSSSSDCDLWTTGP